MNADEWLLVLALVVLAGWVVGAIADSLTGSGLAWRVKQAVRAGATTAGLLLARLRTDLAARTGRAYHRYSQED